MNQEANARPAKSRMQKTGLLLGGILFFGILLLDFSPGNHAATRMAAVATLMAVWWITDAIPLYATALLPMILYPLLGILSGGKTAPIYVNSTIFLFIGGFMIALAMQKWGLHRRIALVIIRAIGGGPSRIVLGFMIAAAFLSMWISNTATAIMMMPIGLAIIVQMESKFEKVDTTRFSSGLMLGIAYACSVGGVATLVGTPPNLSLSRIFQITFPEAPPIVFGTWFLMGIPIAIVMLLIIWLMITRIFFRAPTHLKVGRSIIHEEYKKLGPISYEEKTVLFVFLLTAVLWVFRRPLDLGFLTLPGWSTRLPYAAMMDDGTVAMFMAATLFLVPTRSAGVDSPVVMSGDVIKKLPWDIVLLFGGGFALAKGFQETGLSTLIGNNFAGLSHIPPLAVILLVCFTITFLTELTSNTATTEMILPVLASVAVAMEINPLMLMIPATLSASHAFMMPVATPPNAIVFGSQRLKIQEMARIGIFINLVGIAVITFGFYILGPILFDIDLDLSPAWAIITK